jgi:hypothetical protein
MCEKKGPYYIKVDGEDAPVYVVKLTPNVSWIKNKDGTYYINSDYLNELVKGLEPAQNSKG